MIVKALSLWEPWASLMAFGVKTVETRHWSTRHRGPLLVHAAKRWTREQESMLDEADVQHALSPLISEHPTHRGHMGVVKPYHLPLGRAVCLVKMTGCVSTNEIFSGDLRATVEAEDDFGDYSEDRFAWVTTGAHRLSRPLAVTGHQGLFDVEVPDGEYREFIRKLLTQRVVSHAG